MQGSAGAFAVGDDDGVHDFDTVLALLFLDDFRENQQCWIEWGAAKTQQTRLESLEAVAVMQTGFECFTLEVATGQVQEIETMNIEIVKVLTLGPFGEDVLTAGTFTNGGMAIFIVFFFWCIDPVGCE